jgi:hypothetical protein
MTPVTLFQGFTETDQESVTKLLGLSDPTKLRYNLYEASVITSQERYSKFVPPVDKADNIIQALVESVNSNAREWLKTQPKDLETGFSHLHLTLERSVQPPYAFLSVVYLSASASIKSCFVTSTIELEFLESKGMIRL